LRVVSVTPAGTQRNIALDFYNGGSGSKLLNNWVGIVPAGTATKDVRLIGCLVDQGDGSLVDAVAAYSVPIHTGAPIDCPIESIQVAGTSHVQLVLQADSLPKGKYHAVVTGWSVAFTV